MEGLTPQHVLEALPLHVFVLSAEGRFRYLNRAAPGRVVSGLLGAHMRDFILPDDWKFVSASLRRALQTGAQQSLTAEALDADGCRRRYWFTLAPFSERGRVTGVIGWALDVTAERAGTAEKDAALRVKQLTPRQRAVLTLVAQGLSNREIGRRLGVSVRTVETHREQLSDKLDLRGAAALTRFALAARLVN